MPCRRHGYLADAKLLAARDAARRPTGLERAGCVVAFVLDVQVLDSEGLAEAPRAQQRRAPLAEADDVVLVGHRQEVRVLPHAALPALKLTPADSAGHFAEVIAHQQRCAASAGVVGLEWCVAAVTFGALKVRGVRHRPKPPGLLAACRRGTLVLYTDCPRRRRIPSLRMMTCSRDQSREPDPSTLP